jgi:hypothetical protein
MKMTNDIIPCKLSEYELQRKERILENERFLKSLNIEDIVDEIKKSSTTKKNNKRKFTKTNQLPSLRKSCRIDKAILTTAAEESSSSNNKKNEYCRFKITKQDFQLYIDKNYSDQAISHRVINIILKFFY